MRGLSPGAARIAARAAALCEEPLFLVGGAIRDVLLGRPAADLDLACRRPLRLARRLSRALGAPLVVLDEEERVYRLALRDPSSGLAQVDIAGLKGPGIEEDLARRDFPVNALAVALSGDPARTERALLSRKILDPRGGLGDLKARLIRAEADALFAEDPLRLLRAFRIASELGFTIEPSTLRRIKRLSRLSSKPAGERIRNEILLICSAPSPARTLALMDSSRVLTSVFSELEAQRTCAKSYYGPGGVLAHSLETVSRLDWLLEHLSIFGPAEEKALGGHLAGGGTRHRRAVLKLAALLHDVAKPETAALRGGRLRFFGHDALGARRAEEMLRRLRFPKAEIAIVKTVIAHHLRPGNLAASGAVTDRAAYRFFRDIGECSADLLLVAWSDHASYLPQETLLKLLKRSARVPPATLRRFPQAQKTLQHIALVSELMRRLWVRGKAAPKPLLDGHEVMKALALKPGPEVGRALERLREAQALGKVATRAQALAFLLRRKGPK